MLGAAHNLHAQQQHQRRELERQQRREQQQLRELEARLKTKVSRLERQLLDAREVGESLKEEAANLRLELESRPALRDWRQARKRIGHLERQLDAAETALQRANDARAMRKQINKNAYPAKDGFEGPRDARTGMPTQELMARDRLNHKLGLYRIDQLPRETVKEVLMGVCRELECADVSLVVPAVRKMARVMEAVPRMEKFVRDVTSFVFMHAPPSGTLDAARRSGSGAMQNALQGEALEQVLPTLGRWMKQMRGLSALQEFEMMVVSELFRRPHQPPPLPDMAMGAPASGGGGHGGHGGSGASGASGGGAGAGAGGVEAQLPGVGSMKHSAAIGAVRELVELEHRMLATRDIYDAAEGYRSSEPGLLVNRLVTHFRQLFGVKTMDGMFPKMNEVYLFVNEMENFLRMVRAILGLSDETTAAAIVAEIRRIVEVAVGRLPASQASALRSRLTAPGMPPPQQQQPPPQPQNFVVGEGHPEVEGVGAVREMTKVVRELQKVLGAGSVQDILPRASSMLSAAQQGGWGGVGGEAVGGAGGVGLGVGGLGLQAAMAQ